MKTIKKTKKFEEQEMRMVRFYSLLVVVFIALISAGPAHADSYSNTIEVFRKSKAVQPFFNNAYGYVVFPAIGKGGFGIGGAYGRGLVYRGENVTGKASLIKLSIGWQAGGQAFSEIIFFQDKRAYQEFTSGEFAFDAQASAVAITAGAEAQLGEKGVSAGASVVPGTAGIQAKIEYRNGMAVFVHVKGGLMYEAAIGGQKFNFKPAK
jgi:lipid-binding SYLF domain-containing protein